MYEKIEKYTAEEIPGRGFEIRGVWKDDLHELHSRLVIDMDTYKIIEADAEGANIPFEICSEGLKCIKNIEGVTIGPGLNRVVNQKLTGPTGCIHLAEMVMNSVKALIQAASREIPDWIDDEVYLTRFAQWEKMYRDKCIFFSQPSVFGKDAYEKMRNSLRNPCKN